MRLFIFILYSSQLSVILLHKLTKGETASVKSAVYLKIPCYEEEVNCSGSIINTHIVLTAASCLFSCDSDNSQIPKNVTVYYGGNFLSSRTAYIIDVHQQFNSDRFTNDIALLKMQKPFVFDIDDVKRVALLKYPEDKSPALTVWGRSDMNALITMKITQEVLSRHECIEDLSSWIPEGTFCGKVNIPGYRNPTQEELGSALLIEDFIQIGIVSYFKSNGDGEHVTVFTNISYHYEWIIRNAPLLYCKSLVDFLENKIE